MSQPESTAATLSATGRELEPPADFPNRHIGPDAAEIAAMLKLLGAASLDELVARTVPAGIRLTRPLELPPAVSEEQALAELAAKASRTACCARSSAWATHDYASRRR